MYCTCSVSNQLNFECECVSLRLYLNCDYDCSLCLSFCRTSLLASTSCSLTCFSVLDTFSGEGQSATGRAKGTGVGRPRWEGCYMVDFLVRFHENQSNCRCWRYKIRQKMLETFSKSSCICGKRNSIN